jgi:hypothetical protein
LRRVFNGASIFKPDTAHLHLKLFNFFMCQPNYKKIANPLVTLTLCGLWIFPLFAIAWTYHKPFFIWIAIIVFMIFYVGLYAILHSMQKKLV